MIKRWDFRALMPADDVYIGSAKVSFRTPDGEVSGPCKVEVHSDGHVNIGVEIEQSRIPDEYHGYLMPFLSGEIPKVTGKNTIFRPGGTQQITNVEATTQQGIFRGARAIISNSNFGLLSPERGSIVLSANDLEFVAGEQSQEEIWCALLFGDLEQFRGAETAWSIEDRGSYISFDVDGNAHGLEIIKPSENLNSSCDAVVFGEIGTRPHGTVDEVRRLLPTGLMSALSFAAGNGIRAPWCELRTFRGDLVRRLHVRAGMNPQAGGFPSFSRFDSARSGSGIGAFLNCYFSLSFDRRLSLIAPMNLIRSGTPGDATVDESIADLMKALDAVCKINDVTRQSLTLKLDSGCSKVVAEILEGAREKLKYLRRECVTDGRLDQLCVLDRIISRQANVAGEERDFGIAFAELLQKLRLFDFDAMNAYYSQLSKPLTWESLISFVRGQVIHSGAIDMGGTGEILRWFEFLRHLHDICKRVLLREVGYQGTYAATNVTYTGQYEIDRVKPSMQPRELGYSAAPITI